VLAVTDNTALKTYLNDKKKSKDKTITSLIEIPTKKLPVIKATKSPEIVTAKLMRPSLLTKPERISEINEHVTKKRKVVIVIIYLIN